MTQQQHDTVRAIVWEDHSLRLLDQRLLPGRIEYVELRHAPAVAQAIADMVVRGAPAIGITAAYGVALSAYEHGPGPQLEADLQVLAGSRPTAVNLFWALERMQRAIARAPEGEFAASLLAEARRIHEEDIAANRRIGELGAGLIAERCAVLTHCNTGSLATGGYGTALGVIRSAYAQGKIEKVFADETRPWLQGARLTAWELVQDRIPVTLIVDGAAPYLMTGGEVDWVIVGADRITANGDVANKIGTYAAAVAARHHGLRFMVAAPSSTIDMSLASGSEIPIETRGPTEVLGCAGRPIAPEGSSAWNPVFDVTPAGLIDAIVTERGIVLAPTAEKMQRLMTESSER